MKPKIANTTKPAYTDVKELQMLMITASLCVLFLKLLYVERFICDPNPNDKENKIWEAPFAQML